MAISDSMPNPIQRILKRATWLKVHLYLAIIAGFFFALIGLSGSLGIFREEPDELLNPQLVIDEPQGKYQSLYRIMVSVRAAHPNRLGSWTLEMPSALWGQKSGPAKVGLSRSLYEIQ
jgi:uncharacterized iron-regulated membrane protein